MLVPVQSGRKFGANLGPIQDELVSILSGKQAAQRHVLYTIIFSFKSIYFDACMFNNI